MCAVCCVAMATGTEPKDVYEFLRDGRVMGDPINTAEECLYLFSRGFVRGTGFEPNRIYDIGELSLSLWGQPALVDVKSSLYEGMEHALYWDGKNLRDPNPRTPDIVRWEDYEVIRIWPLTELIGFYPTAKRLFIQPRPEPPSFVLECRAFMESVK